MKLCMPSTNEAGLEARVSPHFGSAPYFTLVDSETGVAEPIVNAHARHDHGHCQPTAGLEGRGIDAVVCRGLGGRALALLEGSGIAVYATDAFTVRAALEAFREGRVARMTPAQACGGHDHEHGHGRNHGHIHDHGHHHDGLTQLDGPVRGSTGEQA